MYKLLEQIIFSPLLPVGEIPILGNCFDQFVFVLSKYLSISISTQKAFVGHVGRGVCQGGSSYM